MHKEIIIKSNVNLDASQLDKLTQFKTISQIKSHKLIESTTIINAKLSCLGKFITTSCPIEYCYKY